MLRGVVLAIIILCSLRGNAAEKLIDFSRSKLNEPPEGFRSLVTGNGKPGDWKILLDRAPSALPPVPGRSQTVADQSVLAQLSPERIDDHFPVLVYDDDLFDDFSLQTQIKMVGGVDEQMAGVAFHFQDAKNYCYIRASALGDTFSFFRVADGQLVSPVSSKYTFETNVWYKLAIDCRGNEIRASINEKELLLVVVRDAPLAPGKIGFWTKSDSVSFFGPTRITYTPRQTLAQQLIDDSLKRYPRLQGLKIFAAPDGKSAPRVIAGTNPTDIGRPGQAVEKDVIARSAIYYGKEEDSVLVTLPLHDANGETVGAVKVTMKSFPGQTEKNAIARALPIVKGMEARVQKAADLIQ
jgi:hypothetical protein